jgi:hypothetical protein
MSKPNLRSGRLLLALNRPEMRETAKDSVTFFHTVRQLIEKISRDRGGEKEGDRGICGCQFSLWQAVEL